MKRKLKILHILGEIKPSGAETMLHSAADAWKADLDTWVLSTGSQEGVYADSLRGVGYTIRHIPFSKSYSFFRKVSKLVTENQFDVVQIHTEKANFWYALSIRIFVGKRVKLIRLVHHIFRFRGLLRITRMVGRHIMKRLLNVSFVSNSKSGANNEAVYYFLDHPIIPNWYDSKAYKRRDCAKIEALRNEIEIPQNSFVFVSLGGNWSYKNYDMVVQALAMIPSDVDVLYVQVGVQGDEKPLEKLAEELGVSARLHCAGVVDNPREYLDIADVYLMPSSEEGFGIAAVEAMASGLPSILGNVEALVDFKEVVRGVAYVEPEVNSIAEMMIEFIGKPQEELRVMGDQASNDVEMNYGLNVGPVAFLKLYTQLVE